MKNTSEYKQELTTYLVGELERHSASYFGIVTFRRYDSFRRVSKVFDFLNRYGPSGAICLAVAKQGRVGSSLPGKTEQKNPRQAVARQGKFGGRVHCQFVMGVTPDPGLATIHALQDRLTSKFGISEIERILSNESVSKHVLKGSIADTYAIFEIGRSSGNLNIEMGDDRQRCPSY